MEATIMGALDLTPKSYNHALVRYESNCGRKVTAGRRQMITPPKRHDLQCSVKEQDERKNEADHVLNYANEEILTGFACQRDSFTPPSYGDATSLHYLQTDELEYPQQLSADSTLRASHDAEFTMPGSSIWPVLSPVQSSCHEIVDADRLICWDVSSSQDELGSWAGDKPDIIRQLECSTKPVGTYTAAGRDINLDRRVFDWLEDIDGNPDYAAFEEPVVVESSIAEDIHSCGLLLAEVHTRLRNWCDVMSQASQKLQTVRNRLLEEEDRPLDVAHLGDSERPLLSNIVSEYERRKKFRTHQLSARFEDIRSEFASLSKSVDDSVDRSNFLRWSRLADEDQGCRKRKRKLEEDASEMNVERGAKKARDGYHRNAIARLGDDERVLSNSDG
ncbi:hypothetical protein B0H34DRAFT_726768 [Crassisporium funariophilum]|nr:hypothetical protein B0H34DRAFT_726768 [Crassisporium funariophilum]